MKTTQEYITAFSKYCAGAAETKEEKEKLDLRKSQIGENQYKLPADKKKRAARLQKIQDMERKRRLARLQREMD